MIISFSLPHSLAHLVALGVVLRVNKLGVSGLELCGFMTVSVY